MGETPTPQSFILSCSSTSPSLIAHAFNSIFWKSGTEQFTTMTISEAGICASTDDSVTQASVLLRSNLFNSFAYMKDEPTEIKIALAGLVSCLRLYCESADRIEILINLLNDIEICVFNGSSETKSILHSRQIANLDGGDAFNDDNDSVAASFRMDSSVAREFFVFPNEPRNMSLTLAITIDPIKRQLHLLAEGPYGNCVSKMPLTGSETRNVCINLVEPITFSYSVVAIQPMLKALDYSNQIKFSFKKNGKLAVQHSIKVDDLDSIETYVDFVIPPLESD